MTLTLHSLFQSKMADSADFLNGDDLEAISDILEADNYTAMFGATSYKTSKLNKLTLNITHLSVDKQSRFSSAVLT